jgi:hypothetical protein
MKKTTITYWVFTSLFAFVMVGSAIPDILVSPVAVEGFKGMGYPAYLIPFLGWAKLLGVAALLLRGFPRLKEWAYAGLFYDLLGATYSVFSIGKSATDWMPMLVILGLGIGSYVFYHKKVKAVSSRKVEANQGDPRSEGTVELI